LNLENFYKQQQKSKYFAPHSLKCLRAIRTEKENIHGLNEKGIKLFKKERLFLNFF